MKRIFNHLLKYWKKLIFPTVALLLVIALDSGKPFLHRMIIDQALPEKSAPLLTWILIGLFVITTGRALFGFYMEFSFDKIGILVYRDLKNMLFDHIQQLHFAYFDNMNTGEIMARLGEDLENIWRSLSFGFRMLLEEGAYFIIGVVVLGSINWKLTLIILLIMAPIGFLAVSFERKINQNFEAISDQTAILNTTAQENIAGVRLVKAFAREKHEIRKFLTKNKENYDLNNEQAQIMANNFPIIELLTNLAVITMIAIGAFFVTSDEMTLGSLAIFSGFIWNLIWPLRNLGWLMNMTGQFSASVKKILVILNTESEVTDAPGLTPHQVKGDVEFKNVTFSYQEEAVLNDVSFKTKAGDTVALMGTTGSGKTSVLALIGRYYNHEKGSVLVDGIETKDLRLDDLRGAMSVVHQDTFLFSESIGNNLKFANADASEEDIREALRIACADFVWELDEGLDTVIGERGVGLSGGQKQRLAIARAILKESPILILDDATSALDMETEYQLLKNLKGLRHPRTTFIIAHRISAVKNADQILYMENGHVMEIGTHDDLVQHGGRYAEVYKEQFQDFENLTEVI